jgi:hypothetical protein
VAAEMREERKEWRWKRHPYRNLREGSVERRRPKESACVPAGDRNAHECHAVATAVLFVGARLRDTNDITMHDQLRLFPCFLVQTIHRIPPQGGNLRKAKRGALDKSIWRLDRMQASSKLDCPEICGERGDARTSTNRSAPADHQNGRFSSAGAD